MPHRARDHGILARRMTAMTAPPRLPPFWIVIAISILGPFSLHVVIPAMPLLAAEFGTDIAAAQTTLTAYLVGIAGGQLIYAPLSDRFGRRPVVLGGLLLYDLGGRIAEVAGLKHALPYLRLFQGATGSAGHVLGRAIIRDCHPRDRAASLMGYATMAMSCCASFSPLLAAIAQDLAGWRSVFFALSTAAALVLAAALARLDETNPPCDGASGTTRLATSYLVLLRAPAFLAYALSTAFANAAWYAFIAGAPHVMTAILGLPPIAYGQYVLIVLGGYIAGNFLAGRLSVRLGGTRMIAIGQGLALLGVALQVALLALAPLGPLALFVPMALIVFASGLFLPNTNAGALSVFPQIAGAAAGLTGFLQMGGGALTTLLVGGAMDGSAAPLIAIIAATSALSALSLLLLPRLPR